MSIQGFTNYKRRTPGSPDPEMVGQLLLQQSQNGPTVPRGVAPNMGADMEMDEAEPMDGPGEEAEESVADPLPNEPDPHQIAVNADWPSSAESALRAAILRAPGTKPGQNQAPPNPANRLQLQRMGIPEDEIDLLGSTGGANV